jgi:hypothetical protein
MGRTRQELNVAKLGDSKPCFVCGGVAILQLVQPSLATLGWVDDRSIPYDIPPLTMWQCEDCDDRQPAEHEVEI